MSPRSKRRGRRPRRPLILDNISFNRGMRDSLDVSLTERDKAFGLQNCFPAAFSRASGIIGRPGFTLAGGTTGSRVQCIHQFSKLNSDELTIIIGSGEIYQYNWALDTTTRLVNSANLVTAGIALNTTRRVYLPTFTDKLHISDGVNTPFLWDGTSGSSGLTSLTASPPLYGQPTVYYAKICGIKTTERSTWVWSEEADATIGYEAGGFNNAWTMGQTDQEALYHLEGTNEALYFWRARSIGAVWGAISDDFQSSGTQEGVSPTVGSISQAMASKQNTIYFLSAAGRPYRLFTGEGRIERLDDDLVEQVKLSDPAQLLTAGAVYIQESDLIAFNYVATGGNALSGYSSGFSVGFSGTPITPDKVFCLDEETGEAACTFKGFTPLEMALVKHATDGTERLMHGDASGNIYYHGTAVSGPWSDNTGSDVAIAHVVESQALGYDTRSTKTFDRLDIAFGPENNDLEAMTVSLTGPSGTGLPQTITQVEKSGREMRGVVGLNHIDRWARVKLEHEQLGEKFTLYTMAVEAYVDGPEVDRE